MKMIFICTLLGLSTAGFTACSSTPRAKPVSDLESAELSLAASAVEICLGNTVYITNRHASVLAPKLVAGQPQTCGMVVAKKAHKK